MLVPLLVVLYYPDKETIFRLLEIQKNSYLHVYDNTPTKNNEYSEIFLNYNKSGKNDGITGAILWMIKQSKLSKINNFIFFDQDTYLEKRIYNLIKNKVDFLTNDINIIHFTSKKNNKLNYRFVINSGSIFNINFLIRNIEILNDYFVDAVDLALCAASHNEGCAVQLHVIEGIDHVCGQGYEEWSILFSKQKIKTYKKERRCEFYSAHFKLLRSLIRINQFVDSALIIKFIIGFYLQQFKADFFIKFGQKL